MKLGKKVKTGNIPIVTIVSSSLVMERNLADGRSIPLIIMETTDYPEIQRAIELHKATEQGDVSLTWGKTPDSKYVVLVVEAISPVEIKYMIGFEVSEHYGLLDMVLKTHLLFVQAGKEGDRITSTFNKPRILLELPITDFEPEIFRLIKKAKRKRFKRLKVKRKDLKEVIEQFDKEWENFTSKRFK